MRGWWFDTTIPSAPAAAASSASPAVRIPLSSSGTPGACWRIHATSSQLIEGSYASSSVVSEIGGW